MDKEARVLTDSFCFDCPDHEACATGWPCYKVKELDSKGEPMAEVRFPRVERGIGTYPVGLLSDIKAHKVKYGMKMTLRSAWEGNWRAVRNHFNGYLAEWHYPPEIRITRCGRGWTRRAAIRRLGKHIARENLSAQERER